MERREGERMRYSHKGKIQSDSCLTKLHCKVQPIYFLIHFAVFISFAL